MSTYNKEQFVDMLQSYIDKINNKTLTIDEGLLLTEFFTKTRLQRENASEAETKEDLLAYAFLGYYIKELCKQK